KKRDGVARAAPAPWSQIWTFRVVFLPQDRINERTIRFPADQSRFAVDRTTPADHGAGPLLVRGLSGAASPQLLGALGPPPRDDAGPPDPARRDRGDALPAACRSGLQV